MENPPVDKAHNFFDVVLKTEEENISKLDLAHKKLDSSLQSKYSDSPLHLFADRLREFESLNDESHFKISGMLTRNRKCVLALIVTLLALFLIAIWALRVNSK